MVIQLFQYGTKAALDNEKVCVCMLCIFIFFFFFIIVQKWKLLFNLKFLENI